MHEDKALELFEQRLATVEKLVGSFSANTETTCFDLLNETNNKLIVLQKNIWLNNVMQQANDIKKYTGLDFLNELNEDQNAKIQLILKDEAQIRKMNEDFDKLKSLSNILNSGAFKDVPQLTEKLRSVSLKQALLKDDVDAFTGEMKDFLKENFTAIKAISETLAGLDDYLRSFEKHKVSDDKESYE